jgi:hypothetical protein
MRLHAVHLVRLLLVLFFFLAAPLPLNRTTVTMHSVMQRLNLILGLAERQDLRRQGRLPAAYSSL